MSGEVGLYDENSVEAFFCFFRGGGFSFGDFALEVFGIRCGGVSVGFFFGGGFSLDFGISRSLRKLSVS